MEAQQKVLAPQKQLRPPAIAVDETGKATEFKLTALSSPHMRAFHLAWLSLFSCYFSIFSIPALLPAIRADLRLTPNDTGAAASAAFAGAILSRFLMGPACDLVGPRVACATLSLLTAPVILATSQVTSPIHFIAVRFLLGFSLANFVANQFWMSSMFSSQVVGLANGLAAGWANVGAGATQLVMPLVYSSLITTLNIPNSTAWRVSFIFPAMFQTLIAVLVLLFGQDQPTGHYKQPAPQKAELPSGGFLSVLLNGLTNYRGWVLGLAYGYSFGVELTVDNIIAEYFYDRFGVNIAVAGMIAASFGMANCVSRPLGGVMSDLLGRRFGMRGRLWGLWTVQTVAGLLCVVLGQVGSLWGSFAVMCCFSFFVQAASGLIFGVVPFVSKRSRGVITGMTGCGGTVGAVVTQMLLFSGQERSKQTSISLMGVLSVVCTLPIATIYFPQWGGMLCAGSTDPDSEDQEQHYCMLPDEEVQGGKGL